MSDPQEAATPSDPHSAEADLPPKRSQEAAAILILGGGRFPIPGRIRFDFTVA